MLAGVAQTYANKCNWGHNGNRNAESKDSGFTNVGENLYMTTASTVDVKNVVQAWFNEKPDYNYNSKTCAAGKMCGHYTQVSLLCTILKFRDCLASIIKVTKIRAQFVQKMRVPFY